MRQYLQWELNADPATPKKFEEMVCKDFPGIGPRPDLHPPVDKEATTVTALWNPLLPRLQLISPSPCNEQCYTSPPKVPYIPSPPPYVEDVKHVDRQLCQ